MIRRFGSKGISTITMVCLCCGFKYENISKYYWFQVAKRHGQIKCGVCQGQDWRQKKFCTKVQLENSLWKKLVYVQNREKFRDGRWKLNQRYKKAYDKHVESYSEETRKALLDRIGRNPIPEGEEEET